MEIARRLSTIGEYYFSRKLREIEALQRGGMPVLNLGVGSPDLPPHPDVMAALCEAAVQPGHHGYKGYRGVASLRKAMAAWYAQWYGVRLDADREILPLAGSKEGIMHLSMAYLNEGDRVLVPNPGYPTYRAAATIAGATCIDYALHEANGWEPDLDALERDGLEGVKMMWVNYPHMPSGQLPSEGLFQRLVHFARRHGMLLCHDNPYSFILNQKPESLLSAEGAPEVAVELNSLSKSHNMAGWRIGMLCGNERVINDVLRFRTQMDSGMFLPLQLAAVKALSLDAAWFKELNATYSRRREKAFELLDALGCRYNRAQGGMFAWARVPQGAQDGFTFSDHWLQQAGIFLTPGGIFGSAGAAYVRVSLCSSESIFEAAIEKVKAHAS